jgi:hypothetical protein
MPFPLARARLRHHWAEVIRSLLIAGILSSCSSVWAQTGLTMTGGVILPPAVPQPREPGDVVGLIVQNTGSGVLAPREITFGQSFLPGSVPKGARLHAVIDRKPVPVQLDVKTTHSDGSAGMGIITLKLPRRAAGASTAILLATAPEPAPQPPVDIARLGAGGYDVAIDLVLHDGADAPHHLELGTLLAQALKAGKASYWLQGPEVTEVRVDTPIDRSLHIVCDIRAYADGSTSTDVQFDNDYASVIRANGTRSDPQINGGTVRYDATIRQHGAVLLNRRNVTHYQYQTWHQVVYSAGAPTVNIQHDIGYLERTGAIQNYDLATGVSAALIASEVDQLKTGNFGPLGSGHVMQYMPTSGGRPDVGPLPQWDAAWLITQDPRAARYALAQADIAGSVPWHMFDPTVGHDLTLAQYPNLWTDLRGGPSGYTDGLTQSILDSWHGSGWAPDDAHQPDLSYVAYLLTGSRSMLDQLNAQATWDENQFWPAANARNAGQGLVTHNNQIRAAAWDLREIDEAAYANPDGSAMKAYFTDMQNNNFRYLLRQLPAWTQQQGEAHGYIPGGYGTGELGPWQQDYFATTLVQAAGMGNADAVTVLKWMSNFLVGRFLNQARGFSPRDGAAYLLKVGSADGAKTYTTWAEIEQATTAAGLSNGTGWEHSQGDFGQLALASLAGIITVTGSPEAIQAYRWLLGSGAPHIGSSAFQADPTFSIVPRRTAR